MLLCYFFEIRINFEESIFFCWLFTFFQGINTCCIIPYIDNSKERLNACSLQACCNTNSSCWSNSSTSTISWLYILTTEETSIFIIDESHYFLCFLHCCIRVVG